MALAAGGGWRGPFPAPQPAFWICPIAQGVMGWAGSGWACGTCLEGKRTQGHIAVGTGGCVLAVGSFPAPGKAHGSAWRGSSPALALHPEMACEDQRGILVALLHPVAVLCVPRKACFCGGAACCTHKCWGPQGCAACRGPSPSPSFLLGQEGPSPGSFLCRDGTHGASAVRKALPILQLLLVVLTSHVSCQAPHPFPTMCD